ncbi:hypothetical protein KM043_007971 [Ampulex compressa]|nr:hypothetical protein KM043_007971 [Ampulex compressa]
MASYSHVPLDNNLQALDFTSCVNRPQSSEPPILDLSCKRQITHDTPYESRSSSPASSEKQQSFAEAERKSPFEGRTFMVTPPSETDSPKKTKYEPIYNAVGIVGQHPGFSGMSIAAQVLPTLLASKETATSSTYSGEVALPGPESGKKAPRPFKAYPKDPLSLTMGTAELMYDQNSNEAYSEFRKRMLDSVRRTSEGTNIKMRRVTKSPGLPTSTVDEKDAAYWERRRKNNEAAKRSRDARRAKEDEIAIRAAFLEQENMKLKYELVALRNETAKLRCMVYSS